MTTLHLVRHGQTIWHRENRYAGSSDVALDAVGLEQAQRLAQWAAQASLAAVVASDLTRAIVTATPAADAAGVALRVDPRLREASFGDAEGLTAAEQRARFPAERARFERSPASSPLPGGEPGGAVALRAVSALRDLVDEHGDDDAVLVVAHSTVVRLVLCSMLGLPLDEYRRVLPRLDNVAITTVEVAFDGDGMRAGLRRLNAPPSA